MEVREAYWKILKACCEKAEWRENFTGNIYEIGKNLGIDDNICREIEGYLNADGYISMVIKPEVSSITSFFPDSASEQRVPVVETAIAASTVLVKDGTTIIIAGMIKDTKTLSTNRVPGLGRIPVIGKLFSNESDEIQRTETIVFLTPRIITGDEQYLLERNMIKDMKGIRK